jgi:hypothetical protein
MKVKTIYSLISKNTVFILSIIDKAFSLIRLIQHYRYLIN